MQKQQEQSGRVDFNLAPWEPGYEEPVRFSLTGMDGGGSDIGYYDAQAEADRARARRPGIAPQQQQFTGDIALSRQVERVAAQQATDPSHVQ